MGKKDERLAKILCGSAAILITAYLFVSKSPPFSVIGSQEETMAEAGVIPELVEPASVDGGGVIVVASESLDHMIEADAGQTSMKEGANTWAKTLTLINPSTEPVKMYFLGQVCRSALR